MSDEWEEFPFFRRFRRFFLPSFREWDEFFREFERYIEEEFKRLEEMVPRELVRERRTERGVEKIFGPFVYGYSITIGPDRKPIIREFGNIRPGLGRRFLELRGEREPLVDVITEEDVIRVVAELPGVNKEDIQLNVADKLLTIKVDTPERKYYKEIDLPEEVMTEDAKASYKNGVLEVILKKKKTKPKGVSIKVE